MAGGVFQPVDFGGYFGYRGQAFSGGPSLPVPILLVLQGLKVAENASIVLA
jgi:hypothetical protein